MLVRLFGILLLQTIVLIVLDQVNGHGRMIDPPGRSTAWRYGFPTPKNYDDNQLFCGGFQVSLKKNSPLTRGASFPSPITRFKFGDLDLNYRYNGSKTVESVVFVATLTTANVKTKCRTGLMPRNCIS